MTRVHILCEGQTELTFVRELLQPAFPGLTLIPCLPGKTFGKARGGDVRYDRVKPDLLKLLKHDRACRCTTFFDYYALGEFPECEELPRGASPEDKAARIEHAVADDIAKELGSSFDSARFYPYLSMHEFEALLFSDPARLAEGLYHPELDSDLTAIRSAAASPEHINDRRATAPSKRLAQVCADYDKVTGGNIAALVVGLDAMRRECSHFRKWLAWLAAV